MAESIESKAVPVSIRTIAVVVLFFIGIAGGVAMWGQTIKSTVDRNCHDIAALEVETKNIKLDKAKVETSVAVVISELGYMKSSLSRIETALTRSAAGDREYRAKEEKE